MATGVTASPQVPINAVNLPTPPSPFRVHVQHPQPCPVTCGGGTSQAANICVAPGGMPVDIQQCGLEELTTPVPCAPEECGNLVWTFTEWGECEGETVAAAEADVCAPGVRRREFTCQGGDAEPEDCEREGATPPEASDLVWEGCTLRECVEQQGVWSVGVWEDNCSELCIRSRSVTCEVGGIPAEDDMCIGTKPKVAVGCALEECPVQTTARRRRLQQVDDGSGPVLRLQDCESGIRAA